MKPTDIFTNNLYSMFNETGWKPRPKCYNSNRNCHHERAPRGSKTGTQGLSNDYERSKIPESLCREILIKSTLNTICSCGKNGFFVEIVKCYLCDSCNEELANSFEIAMTINRDDN